MPASQEEISINARVSAFVPHNSASSTPTFAALRRILSPWSSAKQLFDRCVERINEHTPAPPPYVAWNLARFALSIEFLSTVVRGKMLWLDIGSDPWFCLLAKCELGASGIIPTGYDVAEVQFRTADGAPVYQFESVQLRIAAGLEHFEGIDDLELLTAFEVFEHLPEHPAGFLCAANGALKLGGRLVISTPNIASWSSIERLLDGATPHMTPLYGGPMDHRKEYTVWEVKQLLSAAGFRIERICTHDVYTNERRTVRSAILRAGHMAWHAVSIQPKRLRNLLRFSGSTMFVDAVKIAECDMKAVAGIRV